MGWWLLMFSLVGAALTYNVWKPTYRPSVPAGLSFFAGWLYGELGLHHIAWQLVATLWFIWRGALHGVPGRVGLLITIVSWVCLWRWYWRGQTTASIHDSALGDALGSNYLDEVHPDWSAKFPLKFDWQPVLRPFPMRHRDVERVADIQYARAAGQNLKLDVYRHRSHPERCPVLLQIHGGGWVIGSKNEQGLPLMMHMASRGWLCVSADYRLSPGATFPDHLVDLKRAIHWIRTEGVKYGADPDFIIATGGSAGGHLTALVALTQNDPEYQPGFEDANTSVRGAVPFYGVYDFTNRHGTMPNTGLRDLLETRVMKASIAEAPQEYEKASPIARVHADAPPMMVIHGGCDALVPVADARNFVAALRAVSKQPVVYVELPEAQHAFEIFPTLRSQHTIHSVERFLAHQYSKYLAEKTSTPTEIEMLRQTA